MQTVSNQSSIASPPSAFAEKLVIVFSWIILVLGLSTIAVTASLVVISYFPAPYLDHWAVLHLFAQHKGSISLSLLWTQHNEHRIFFPKLFYLIDLYFAGGQNIFLLAAIFSLQLLHLALWGRIFHSYGFARVPWRTAFGITAFCLFCPNQYENFILPIQVAYVIPPLALTVSLAALLQLGKPNPSPQTKIKIVFLLFLSAVVGSYSFSNGILVWPLLLLGGIVLRLPLKTILLLCVAGGVTLALFFVGYSSESQLLLFLHSHLLEGVEFVLLNFGESWKHIHGGLGGVLAGLVILVAAVLFLRMLVTRGRKDVFLFLPLATIVFCCATSAMTAVGRLRLGEVQASNSRYQLFAMLFWMSVALLIVRWLWKRPDTLDGAETGVVANPDPLAALSFQSSVLWVMLLAATAIPELRRDIAEHRKTLETTSLALVTGVPDVSLAGVVPNQAFVSQYFNSRTDLQFLRELRASFYADSFYLSYGNNLNQVYTLAPKPQCSGALESVRPIADTVQRGARVTGWAWDATSNRPISKVVIVTPDGVISGLARGNGFGLDRQTSIAHPSPTIWRGFLQSLPQPVSLRAYALVGDGRSVCPLDISDLVSSDFSGKNIDLTPASSKQIPTTHTSPGP